MPFNAQTQEIHDQASQCNTEARTYQSLMDNEEVGSARYKELEICRDAAFAKFDHIMGGFEAAQRQASNDELMNQRFHEHRISEHRPAASPHIQLEARSPYEVEDREKLHVNLFLGMVRAGATAGRGAMMEFIKEHKEQYLQVKRHKEAMGDDKALVLNEKEERDLGVTTATDISDHVVPVELVNDIDRAAKAYGPMWDASRTRRLNTAGGGKIEYPTVDDTGNGMVLYAEKANRAATTADPTFSHIDIDAIKYGTPVIKVSRELLQDSQFNMRNLITDLFAERVGRGMNNIFYAGSGAGGNIEGLANAANQTARRIAAGAATALTFNDILNLIHHVDPAYRAGPLTYMQFNDSTLKVLRGVTTGISATDRQPLWTMGDVRRGEPAAIWGVPYVVQQEAPNVGANAASILYGDHNKFITRVAQGMVFSMTTELYWANDQIGMKTDVRADTGMLQLNAFALLRHPSS